MQHSTVDPPEAYFHDDSGSVRFWVQSGPLAFVGASIRREILNYRFKSASNAAEAVDTYRAQQTSIDAAVLRRIALGSIEPVMLREADLDAPPAG
jgi:hypothetical protein